MLARYLTLPVELHDHRPLLGRILELRNRLTAYDAAYVALAELLGAPLMTADGPLARAARAHTAVQVLA